MKKELIEKAYEIAKERYAALGIDTEAAMDKLQQVQLSLHCWQAVSGQYLTPASCSCRK